VQARNTALVSSSVDVAADFTSVVKTANMEIEYDERKVRRYIRWYLRHAIRVFFAVSAAFPRRT
jgi:hypothetical protein